MDAIQTVKVTKVFEKSMQKVLLKAAESYAKGCRTALKEKKNKYGNETNLAENRQKLIDSISSDMLKIFKTELNKQLEKEQGFQLNPEQVSELIEGNPLLSNRNEKSLFNQRMKKMFSKIEEKARKYDEKTDWRKVIEPTAKVLAGLLVAALITIVLTPAVILGAFVAAGLGAPYLAALFWFAPQAILQGSTAISGAIALGSVAAYALSGKSENKEISEIYAKSLANHLMANMDQIIAGYANHATSTDTSIAPNQENLEATQGYTSTINPYLEAAKRFQSLYSSGSPGLGK
jgi:hypothetical protein